jgi:predicted XRE-type DNA-binding protein
MVKSKTTVNKQQSKQQNRISSRRTVQLKEDVVVEFYECSDNVFKDMGIPDEEATYLVMRSDLMIEIEKTIKSRGWTQAHAAKIIGVAQPRIAELFSSRIDLFSIDTLIKYLYKLGREVTINVKDSLLA